MTDRKEIIRGLYETREFYSYGLLGQHPTSSKYQEILTDTISLIKEQEQTIEALKEKLRLLEYGNHDCVQDVLMPAT